MQMETKKLPPSVVTLIEASAQETELIMLFVSRTPESRFFRKMGNRQLNAKYTPSEHV